MNILYLVHRIPFPPNKGDKIRSYRWLEHLAASHRVHLVTLCDNPADLGYVENLRPLCASIHVTPIRPLKTKLGAVASLPNGRPMSLSFFHHRDAQLAVDRVLRENDIDLVLGFSAPMAEYVRDARVPRIMDMVDVDSAKFASYAKRVSWPMSSLYALEARRLGQYEEQIAREFEMTLLCTEPETALLRDRCPDGRLDTIGNGAAPPDADLVPASRTKPDLVFVGAMDYFANVDAVEFAAREIMPLVLEKVPEAVFRIVGRDPTPAVRALDREPGVEVLGEQPDLTRFLADAALSLIPLRIAQGIQNKVLEAMGWELPVVTSPRIVESLGAEGGRHLFGAESASEYAGIVVELLEDAGRRRDVGREAREFVLDRFSWKTSFDKLDRLISEVGEVGAAAT